MRDREKWLNGWSRNGGIVIIGTGIHCSACGKFGGITSVAFSDDWVAPEKNPDWPFTEGDCPVCDNAKNVYAFSVEELSGLSESFLRKAMILAKKRKT